MDHAVYSIEKVREAVARALILGAGRETAVHAAAQSLGISVEAVREALAISEGETACTS